MSTFGDIILKINNSFLSLPLIVLISFIGVYFTVRLKIPQVFHLKDAFKYMLQKDKGAGDISSFGALCISLSATLGTGNIVGVAGAVCVGGPGALFWMVASAFFGMATKYAEGLLAVKYRVKTKNGTMLGGPFYYIENGMGKKYRPLAKLFALFGAAAGTLGIGTITQVSSITLSLENLFKNDRVLFFVGERGVTLVTVISGTVCAVLAAIIILGGVKRISKATSFVVPFMAVAYVFFCLVIILSNIKLLPKAILLIIKGAFNIGAVSGGAVGSVFTVINIGITRGIFSNESGLGSAPIAAAAAKENSPARQGLISMTSTFIDTIIMCTLTGLVVILTGAYEKSELFGGEVTAYAFSEGISFLPKTVTDFLLSVCLVFFAFTTIIGWNYYAKSCFEYLVDGKKLLLKIYNLIYIFTVFIGVYIPGVTVWAIADFFNALMAFPNLLALIFLRKTVIDSTKQFFKR